MPAKLGSANVHQGIADESEVDANGEHFIELLGA